MEELKDYTAWLVENHDTGNPRYLALSRFMNIVWVDDADDALHFARRADANHMTEDGDLHDLRIVEHMWPGGFPRDPVQVYDYDEIFPRTTGLTFSEALDAMMANPMQDWTCSELCGAAVHFEHGDFRWTRDGASYLFALTPRLIRATDWQVMEVEG
jgi:hypothetical protein